MDDLKWVKEEECRIEKILDKKEKQKAMTELLNKINKEAKVLNKQRKEELKKKKQKRLEDIKKRGIIVEYSDLTRTELRQKWESTFAKELSFNEKQDICMDAFLWNIFTLGKKKSLEKEEARTAFNQIKKNKVLAFYEHKDVVILYKNASQLKDTDFDIEDDVYLVDLDFTWTYVVTHEGRIGPFFLDVKK